MMVFSARKKLYAQVHDVKPESSILNLHVEFADVLGKAPFLCTKVKASTIYR